MPKRGMPPQAQPPTDRSRPLAPAKRLPFAPGVGAVAKPLPKPLRKGR